MASEIEKGEETMVNTIWNTLNAILMMNTSTLDMIETLEGFVEALAMPNCVLFVDIRNTFDGKDIHLEENL